MTPEQFATLKPGDVVYRVKTSIDGMSKLPVEEWTEKCVIVFLGVQPFYVPVDRNWTANCSGQHPKPDFSSCRPDEVEQLHLTAQGAIAKELADQRRLYELGLEQLATVERYFKSQPTAETSTDGWKFHGELAAMCATARKQFDTAKDLGAVETLRSRYCSTRGCIKTFVGIIGTLPGGEQHAAGEWLNRAKASIDTYIGDALRRLGA